MKRWFACAMLLAGLFRSAAEAGADPTPVSALPPPTLAAVEHGAYQALDPRNRAPLWRTRWTIRRDRLADVSVLHVQEEGTGQRWGLAATSWTVSMELRLSRRDGHLASTRDVRDLAGQLLQTHRREFDYAAGSGRVSTTDGRTGRTDVKTFPLAADSIGVEMLPVQLRVLPDAPDRSMQFDLITREGSVVGMAARVGGRELVRTPAGTFDCYKVGLVVRGLLGVAANLLLPKMYMWHTVTAPHVWVKYQGPDGGLGSREVVMELVSFEPHPA